MDLSSTLSVILISQGVKYHNKLAPYINYSEPGSQSKIQVRIDFD